MVACVREAIAPGTLIASTLILGAMGMISGMIPAVRAAKRGKTLGTV